MKSEHHRSDTKHKFVEKFFRQLLWGTLLICLLYIILLLVSPDGASAVTVFVIIGIVCIIPFIFYLIRSGKEEQAKAVFILIITFALVYITWLQGGVRDSTIISFPILLTFTAFFAGFRVFLSILCFVLISILTLGASSLYGWMPNPEIPLSWVYIIDAMVIISFSAYLAWSVNAEMDKTLGALRAENKKVLKSNETIQLLVERDSLTGLLSRSACKESYQKLLDQQNPENERIILFFVDLDNFKSINDAFGHDVGDELLISISNGFKGLVQFSDVACRISGDEFVLIMRRDKGFSLDQFATSILNVISKPHYLSVATIRITGSVGIAISPDDGQMFEDISKKADIAMYESKQSGKNSFRYYSSRLHEATLRKASILNGLKDAVDKNLLDLYVQPKVNLSTGKIESAEALLRWNRDNPYDITPGEFIPLIESTEMIHEIGQWCIEESCHMCKRWHDAGFTDMSIAVNVSSMQVMREGFYKLVCNALKSSGLAPEFLEFELTEHVLVQESEIVKKQLKSLKDLGIQLSIDDFGTGYSNLSYLINFKVDTIKLDRSFIAKINTSSDHFVVVKAVIQMAQVLNLRVVAEGVESEAVKQVLIDLKCDYAQGYSWSKALPEEQFIEKLTIYGGNSETHLTTKTQKSASHSKLQSTHAQLLE